MLSFFSWLERRSACYCTSIKKIVFYIFFTIKVDRMPFLYLYHSINQAKEMIILPVMDLLQRKLPSPGFQLEVVLVDYNGNVPTAPTPSTETTKKSDESSGTKPSSDGAAAASPPNNANPGSQDKDDVFSDGEAEETGSSKNQRAEAASAAGGTVTSSTSSSESNAKSDQIASLAQATKQVSIGSTNSEQVPAAGEPESAAVVGNVPGLEAQNSESEFKAMAADASVFTFGDDEDYESE